MSSCVVSSCLVSGGMSSCVMSSCAMSRRVMSRCVVYGCRDTSTTSLLQLVEQVESLHSVSDSVISLRDAASPLRPAKAQRAHWAEGSVECDQESRILDDVFFLH